MRLLLLLPLLLLLRQGLTAQSAAVMVSGSATGSLTLEVENVTGHAGKIWVGIYESEADFLDRERARLEYLAVDRPGRYALRIDRLVPGRKYALAVFHDENDNGELDTNFLGLPAEPWAFSRPLRSWFRLPRFEEMAFVFRPGRAPLSVRLH